MANPNPSNDPFEPLRSAGTDAIDTYERRARETILQGQELVKDVPGVATLASVQATVARGLVDAQASTARVLIGV